MAELDEAHDVVAGHDDDPWKGFELPFPVETFDDVNPRAYVTPDSKAEFLWSRLHAYCEVAQDPSRMLRLNMESINQALNECQVQTDELHYRGAEARKSISEASAQGQCQWKDHTAEPRCMLALLLWLVRNRKLPYKCKVRALNLFLTMGQKALEFISGDSRTVPGMLCGRDGRLHAVELFFVPHIALCHESLKELFSHPPGAEKMWSQLGRATWMDRCISTSLGAASFIDLLFFATYIFAHPKLTVSGQNLFVAVGVQLLPSLIHKLGQWLHEFSNFKWTMRSWEP